MLPQFGFSEFLLLAMAALIIVGPKDLPMMMRKLGQIVAKGRATAKEFQRAFDDIARQTELDDLRKEIEDLKKANTLSEAQADMADFEREVNAEVMRDTAAGSTGDKAPKPAPAAKPAKADPAAEGKASEAAHSSEPRAAETRAADPLSSEPKGSAA